jgi:integrase
MMRKYSVEQYKQFIDVFTKEYPGYREKLYRPIFWEKDIFTLNLNQMKIFLIDEVLSNSCNLKYLLDYMSILNNFYTWCVNKKIISYNIWDAELFTKDIFINYMIDKMNIQVYDKNDIENIISKLPYNKILFEILIRLPYEGASTFKDFCLIKISDINFEEKYINYRNRKLKISDNLILLLKQYIDIKYVSYGVAQVIKEKPVYQYKNFLFKSATEEIATEEQFYNSINCSIRNYYKIISKELKIPEISFIDLFASGFINFVYEQCDENDRYFIKVFEIYNNMKLKKNICQFAKEYGIDKWKNAGRLKLKFFPYVKKSKYYKAL